MKFKVGDYVIYDPKNYGTLNLLPKEELIKLRKVVGIDFTRENSVLLSPAFSDYDLGNNTSSENVNWLILAHKEQNFETVKEYLEIK